MGRRWIGFLAALIGGGWILFSSCATGAAALVEEYDVVVIGAGTGGSIAAVQAARMGSRVALLEASDWVGGQMTGAGVSTMDDVGHTRMGLYGEFIGRVRSYYAAMGRSVNICLWGGDTIATEPAVGQRILIQMLEETGNVKLMTRARVRQAQMLEGRITGVEGEWEGRPFALRAKVFIEATECGDFLPLTGARYRSGNSVYPFTDLSADIQDITYVAVIREYPQGIPDELRVQNDPPGYADYLEKFRATVTRDGNMYPAPFPLNIPSHNAYRAIPDPDNPAVINGADSQTWEYITKTSLNSANDYPGRGAYFPGLPARYLEDRAFRAEQERAAMLKTLCFIRYMQAELGMQWSVDTTQGYGSWFSNGWDKQPALSRDYGSVLSHFPPFPYVREGRRAVGIGTLTATDIRRYPQTRRAARSFSSSLALGEYPVDIHGSHLPRYLEADLGETVEDFPTGWSANEGLFQVPFEVFIPERVDGLVLAEKNLSVSRMVNGAVRLHPITMLTGQAAGTLAGLAAKKGILPRELRPLDVQRLLLKDKVALIMDVYEDVTAESPWWQGIQWAVLYADVRPLSGKIFGASFPADEIYIQALMTAAFPRKEPVTSPDPAGNNLVTRDRLIEVLLAVMPEGVSGFSGGKELVNRGEAAEILFSAVCSVEDR